MNCDAARNFLPGLLYGDSSPEEAGQVQAHLDGCAACRAEQASLARTRRLLDAAPVASANVDVARLYREAAALQERRLRCWRRLAVATLAAAAAVVLLALAPRLEVRCEAHQFVVRWGETPAPEPPALAPPEPPIVVASAPPSAEVEGRLRLLGDLVQALSNEVEARDGRRQQDMAALEAQVLALRRQAGELRLAVEKDVAALYTAQFPETKKGGPQ